MTAMEGAVPQVDGMTAGGVARPGTIVMAADLAFTDESLEYEYRVHSASQAQVGLSTCAHRNTRRIPAAGCRSLRAARFCPQERTYTR